MLAGVWQVTKPALASPDQGISSKESSSIPWPTRMKWGLPLQKGQILLFHIHTVMYPRLWVVSGTIVSICNVF